MWMAPCGYAGEIVGPGGGQLPDDITAIVDGPHRGEISPPECVRCSGLVRPGVVWFGETLPASALESANEWSASADVTLVVGTSSLVYPAAAIPRTALARGRPVVEVNPDPTPLTPAATVSVRETAGQFLPRLIEQLSKKRH